MPEYGNAICFRGPEEPQPEQLLSVHKTLQRNFELSRAKIKVDTGVDLGEQWELKIGSVLPAYETPDCPDCLGQGTKVSIAGHCFDIDGGRWHDVGDCKWCNPPCCPPCTNCEGKGIVLGDVIPGVFEHAFGWYVDTDG